MKTVVECSLYPASSKWKGRNTGFILAVRPSVGLWTESCPLCIFNYTHLIHLYSYILISYFRKCVAFNVSCKISKFKVSVNSLTLLVLTWDPILTNSLGNHGVARVSSITTHLLSIERADWPMLHDMFKARDVKAWQREFPVGFLVWVCPSNLLLINILSRYCCSHRK